MFGPALGGVLAEYGMHVPFLAAAGLSALSIVCTYTLLKESKPAETSDAGPLPGGRRPSAFDLRTYVEYFRRPRLGRLYLQFFLFAFAFSAFTSGFALFAERRLRATHEVRHAREGSMPCEVKLDIKATWPAAQFGTIYVDGEPRLFGRDWRVYGENDDKHIVLTNESDCARIDSAKLSAQWPWTAHEVGLLFMFSGFLGILLQGGLIGRLVKRFGEARLIVAGFIAAGSGYLLLGFAYTVSVLIAVVPVLSFGTGVLRPVITSRITQIAGRHEQGIAIGISGSLSSFAMMLAPPTGGALLDQHWLLAWTCVPAVVSAVGLFTALLPERAKSAGADAKPELSSTP
jgi:MFS family permease